MRHQVPWNEEVYTEFSKLAMLSAIEKEVLRMRIMEFGITATALELCISERTVNRIVNTLKKKYDQVQPLSEKLPVRKENVPIEEWMDNN